MKIPAVRIAASFAGDIVLGQSRLVAPHAILKVNCYIACAEL
jgi:hypothetical protein